MHSRVSPNHESPRLLVGRIFFTRTGIRFAGKCSGRSLGGFAQEAASPDKEFAAAVFLPLTRRCPVTISPAAPAGRHASDISVARGSESRSWAQAGECPERQRGRTVNPLAMPSQVRVLLPPPLLASRRKIENNAHDRSAGSASESRAWMQFLSPLKRPDTLSTQKPQPGRRRSAFT